MVIISIMVIIITAPLSSEARDYHIIIHHNILIIIPSFSTPGRIFGDRYAPGTFRACVEPSPLGTAALAPRLIRTGAFQIHNNSSTCMATDLLQQIDVL